tara:strand:+ start:388 stop:795 length:408 start_codon:yes stop_codon:yes gene_type:complete
LGRNLIEIMFNLNTATYTVTRDVARPNTSTLWPDDYIATASARVDGYANLISSEKVSLSCSVDSDDLVQTCIFVWASKTDYKNNRPSADNPDSTWMSARNQYNTYMAAAGITARITEEDGTVRVFNSSSKTFEEE